MSSEAEEPIHSGTTYGLKYAIIHFKFLDLRNLKEGGDEGEE